MRRMNDGCSLRVQISVIYASRVEDIKRFHLCLKRFETLCYFWALGGRHRSWRWTWDECSKGEKEKNFWRIFFGSFAKFHEHPLELIASTSTWILFHLRLKFSSELIFVFTSSRPFCPSFDSDSRRINDTNWKNFRAAPQLEVSRYPNKPLSLEVDSSLETFFS